MLEFISGLFKWVVDASLKKIFAVCVACLVTVLASPLYAHRLQSMDATDKMLGYMWMFGIWGLVFLFTLLLAKGVLAFAGAQLERPTYKYYFRHGAFWEFDAAPLSDPICCHCLIMMSHNHSYPNYEEWNCRECNRSIRWNKTQNRCSLKRDVAEHLAKDRHLEDVTNFYVKLESKS